MNQKNRLLREAFEMLVMLSEGSMRPLGYPEDMVKTKALRDRIAKNLNLDYSLLQ